MVFSAVSSSHLHLGPRPHRLFWFPARTRLAVPEDSDSTCHQKANQDLLMVTSNWRGLVGGGRLLGNCKVLRAPTLLLHLLNLHLLLPLQFLE